MRTLLLTLAILWAPRAAFACPVCFGQNDSPLARAMNQGILLMLLVVGGMMAAFASFFISLVRRARQAEADTEAQRAHAKPQEGTAQC
jgi:hypothetical protein